MEEDSISFTVKDLELKNTFIFTLKEMNTAFLSIFLFFF